jgi:cytochrome c oxidase assembly factor CtaG
MTRSRATLVAVLSACLLLSGAGASSADVASVEAASMLMSMEMMSEKCVEAAPVHVLGQPVTPAQKRCVPWF